MKHRLVPLLLAVVTLVPACGGDDPADGQAALPDQEGTSTTGTGQAAATSTPGIVPTTVRPDGRAVTDPETPQPIPSTTTTTSTTTTAIPSAPDVYVPPTGTYAYDVEGTTQNSGILGGSQQPLPGSATDEVSVSLTGSGHRVSVVTRYDGADAEQETIVDVAEGRAELISLTQRSDNGTTVTVTPEPSALFAKLPYQIGDGWEIAWNDRASGVSGVGTGEVLRTEGVETRVGSFDTVVVQVTQQLRGTVRGTLDLTVWIDRTSGLQAKQHLITEIQDATGSSRTDAIRTLREIPG